ncbi:MAG: KamA family radical SAM protein [Bacillota bacterium]|jgi:lysine 2,3-aminomutase|nr:KamA family radical SAM protein [Bacillota bacterium]HHU43992.1 KamA family radical SAM protein [Clostridiales bacterium]
MKKWQKQLLNNITTAKELVQRGLIPPEQEGKLQKVIDKYPMNITEYYLGLIEKNDYTDPIYKMSVASILEGKADGVFDTSGEAANTVDNGIQHKYDNTVLLLSTNVCAMYCRHCFRKRFVGLSEEETLQFTDKAIKYIASRPEADNVLITGGDALMNSNKVIETYLEGLSKLKHIKFIRFGSRLPVVLPQRITQDEELVEILKKYKRKKTIYLVTQFNHPRELTQEAKEATDTLREAGIPILNQSVLLAGVNDDPDTLVELFNGLVERAITPYYLFQCRPLKGVKGYFTVPFVKGVKIVDKTRARLSGVTKRFKFVMSHVKGKIEIVGLTQSGRLLLKQHQAKDKRNLNKIFTAKIDENSHWLDNNFKYEFL